MSLNIGDQAPAFSSKDTNDKLVALADYRDKQNVFVVFYYADFSSVCSLQLAMYNKNMDGFKSRNTAVVAINRDSSFSHKAFCESLGGIDFPVLSDIDFKMAKDYGVDLGNGTSDRAEFIIDKSGALRWINVENSPGEDTATMDDIFSALDAL